MDRRRVAARTASLVVVLVLGLIGGIGVPAQPVSASPTLLRPRLDGPHYYPVGAESLAVADFTGDGRADVAAVAGWPGQFVRLLVQTPAGELVGPQPVIAHVGELAFVAAVAADIDGDSDTDLLVGSSNGIDVIEQDAGGLLPGRLIPGLQVYEIDVTDLNADGMPDLVVDTAFTGGLRTMLNLGGGEFGPPATVSTGDWPYQELEIGDVTGDGIADLVGHYVISVHVRAGLGDGTFAPPVAHPIPWPWGSGDGMALGDFNGDSRTDVAVTTGGNNPYAAVWVFAQTAGTLGEAVRLPTLDVPDQINAADMNLDGRTDLVVVHAAWDHAGIYLQKPDGTFAGEQLEFIGRYYPHGSGGLGIGDIDGDGLPDVVTGTDAGVVTLRSSPVSSNEGGFHALAPARILDTRTGTGGLNAPIGHAQTVEVAVAGRGGVPATGVSAVVVNVTVTQPTVGGYLTVFPTATKRPLASSLNFVAGQTVPNLVVAKLGREGKINMFNSWGTTHVVADVVGWYDDDGRATGAHFNALGPARILDSRGGAPLGAGATLDVPVAGRGGFPATGASAVVLNVTVTQPTTGGYLTVFPTGTTRPLASSLNFVASQTVPNLVMAKVGSDGKVSIYNDNGSTHVVLDVIGWYDLDGSSPGSHYTPLPPARILDSRDWTGGVTEPVGPGATVDVMVTGTGGVPASGVVAVVVNATVTEPTVGGYLTIFPTGTARPLASSLNFVAHQTVPNLVVAKVGADGRVGIYNNAGTAHVVFDVVGWYGA